jgi:PII-like signaling protein
MNNSVAMKRLMIFIDETDKWQGRSLSAALLDLLKKEGCSGATVIRGSAGFGIHRKMHTTSIMDLSSSLPEIVLVMDTPEKIESILPALSAIVSEGLFVLDDVEAIKLSKDSPR